MSPLFDRSRVARVAQLPATPPVQAPSGAAVLSSQGTHPPVFMPAPSLAASSSLLNVAMTGGGKTAVLVWLLVWFASRRFVQPSRGLPVHFSVIDRKGDALAYTVGLSAQRCPAALDNLRYINIFARHGLPGAVPLNLALADYGDAPLGLIGRSLAHLIARTATAGEVLAAAVGHRIVAAMTALITGVLHADHPRRSLLWAIDTLQMPGGEGVQRLAQLIPDEHVRNQILGLGSLPSDVKAGALGRLSVLDAWDSVAAQLGAPTCINFRHLVRNHELLVDLSQAPAGADDVVATFGSLLFECLSRALLQHRTANERESVTILYADEALQLSAALSSVARPLLETGRSFGAATWLSAQHLRGLRDLGTTWDAIVSNCPYRLLGKVSAEDARLLSLEQFGSSSDARAVVLARRLVTLQSREFCLAAPHDVGFFRSPEIDFRACERAQLQHADVIRSAQWALSPQQLPRPVRLWEVGGARAAAPSQSGAFPPPRPARRPRSFLG